MRGQLVVCGHLHGGNWTEVGNCDFFKMSKSRCGKFLAVHGRPALGLGHVTGHHHRPVDRQACGGEIGGDASCRAANCSC